MRTRATTFKAWLTANLSEYLHDIANQGASLGYPGLTYYRDTVKLYERFKGEIWELAVNQSEDMGHANVFEMMATFGGAANVTDYTTFANLMTWYAAEHYARELTDQ